MRRFDGRLGLFQSGLRAKPAGYAMAVLAIVAIGIMATSPTATGAERLAVRLAAAAKSLPRRAPLVPGALRQGVPYAGTPAVGALFTISGGTLGSHFCTASVVRSPVKDLLITAAHCLSGKQPSSVAFVPGYHSGQDPYGVWRVTQIFVDSTWASSANPNDDVAFLSVSQPGNPDAIQTLTGGEKLATGWGPRQLVQVAGYPDSMQQPISCSARTRPAASSQMEFDCDGYSNGTSGGPFLANVNTITGQGTVIGVIGGYELGGDLAAVSYSARFGAAAQALFSKSVAAS